MVDSDVPGAVSAWNHAFRAIRAKYGLAISTTSQADELRLQTRMRHFLSTDPEGSWIAEKEGVVVGLSQSFVRDGYWVLSMLATAPESQRHGLGRELLHLAMGNADTSGLGSIQASRDPGAMSLYTSAGFSLHPGVTGRGTVRPGSVRFDPRVRYSDGDDLETVAAIDRAVRGSARSVDIVAMLNEPACQLLILADRGYVLARDDRVVTLGARDEEAATTLLKAVLAQSSEGTQVEVNWLTASQQWAIRSLVDAGVELVPTGPMMVRGMPGPPAPYIPSGGYG